MAAVERIQPEKFMEDRVARLEVTVERLQADVSEIKTDLRRIDAKVDGVKDSLASFRVETKESIASLRAETHEGITSLRLEMKDAIASLKTGRVADRVWWLLMSGALLGVMARGFKWI